MIEILGYAAVSLLLIKYFQPIQPIREWFVSQLVNFMARRRWFWLEYPIKVFTCAFCFSFWFTLAIYQNILISAVVSIIVKITDLIIQKLEDGSSNKRRR
jgi:hypothetical protein